VETQLEMKAENATKEVENLKLNEQTTDRFNFELGRLSITIIYVRRFD
jgi:hypothetical protein